MRPSASSNWVTTVLPQAPCHSLTLVSVWSFKDDPPFCLHSSLGGLLYSITPLIFRDLLRLCLQHIQPWLKVKRKLQPRQLLQRKGQYYMSFQCILYIFSWTAHVQFLLMLLGITFSGEKEVSMKVYRGRKITPDLTDYEEANTRHNFVGKNSVSGNSISSNRVTLP